MLYNKTYKLDTSVHFSELLNQSRTREYLLHFSECQWPDVTKHTLLLGIGYLDFRGVHTNNINVENVLEIISDVFSQQHTGKRKSIAFDITWSCRENKSDSRGRLPASLMNRPGISNRRKVSKKVNDNRLSQHKSQVSPSQHKNSFVRFNPSTGAVYITLRNFFLKFPEHLWQRVIKGIFFLGVTFVKFLGVSVHELSLDVLKTLVYCKSLENKSISSIDYGCAMPSDDGKRTEDRGLLKSRSNKVNSPSLSKTCSKKFSAKRSCYFRPSQQLFPLQWITVDWIGHEKNSDNKFSPVQERYPCWWGQKSPCTNIDRPAQELVDAKKKSRSHPVVLLGREEVSTSQEFYPAVTIMPFQNQWLEQEHLIIKKSAEKHVNDKLSNSKKIQEKQLGINPEKLPQKHRRSKTFNKECDPSKVTEKSLSLKSNKKETNNSENKCECDISCDKDKIPENEITQSTDCSFPEQESSEKYSDPKTRIQVPFNEKVRTNSILKMKKSEIPTPRFGFLKVPDMNIVLENLRGYQSSETVSRSDKSSDLKSDDNEISNEISTSESLEVNEDNSDIEPIQDENKNNEITWEQTLRSSIYENISIKNKNLTNEIIKNLKNLKIKSRFPKTNNKFKNNLCQKSEKELNETSGFPLGHAKTIFGSWSDFKVPSNYIKEKKKDIASIPLDITVHLDTTKKKNYLSAGGFTCDTNIFNNLY